MKRFIFAFVMAALLMTGCYKDDIVDLREKYNALQEEFEKQALSYQTLQNAFENQLTVISVETISSGYKVLLSDGSTVELTQGKDGQDGQNGRDGQDAPSIVNITIQKGIVVFEFSNGDTITIPLSEELIFTLSGEYVQYFQCGVSKEFTITQSGVQNIAITKPDGWRATVEGNKLTVTAPPSENAFAERSGMLTIIALGNYETTMVSMELHARDYNYVVDFENANITNYLAGPTSYGENLYSSFGAGQYIGYEEAGSGLNFMLNEADPYGMGMSREFWNGGIAISQWNDMTTEGYLNQCSAYASDITTGFGGYKGSKTFAVDNNSGEISFKDATKEGVFDHFWVTNTTYAALSMINGDDIAKKFETGDWFKLIISAYDKDGNATGSIVEFYLADLRTADSPGVITEWTMVDLTPLGNKVHKVVFDFASSDMGAWGMNTPTYFCFDNLAIKK